MSKEQSTWDRYRPELKENGIDVPGTDASKYDEYLYNWVYANAHLMSFIGALLWPYGTERKKQSIGIFTFRHDSHIPIKFGTASLSPKLAEEIILLDPTYTTTVWMNVLDSEGKTINNSAMTLPVYKQIELSRCTPEIICKLIGRFICKSSTECNDDLLIKIYRYLESNDIKVSAYLNRDTNEREPYDADTDNTNDTNDTDNITDTICTNDINDMMTET